MCFCFLSTASTKAPRWLQGRPLAKRCQKRFASRRRLKGELESKFETWMTSAGQGLEMSKAHARSWCQNVRTASRMCSQMSLDCRRSSPVCCWLLAGCCCWMVAFCWLLAGRCLVAGCRPATGLLLGVCRCHLLLAAYYMLLSGGCYLLAAGGCWVLLVATWRYLLFIVCFNI